jgi:hypothetical protein
MGRLLMKVYFTIKQTSTCPTNYGLYECKLTEEGENCRLLACVVNRLSTNFEPEPSFDLLPRL